MFRAKKDEYAAAAAELVRDKLNTELATLRAKVERLERLEKAAIVWHKAGEWYGYNFYESSEEGPSEDLARAVESLVAIDIMH